MKKTFFILSILLSSLSSQATIHIVNVWDGYFQFVDAINFSPNITIQLGDTVQWLPLDFPAMTHTITSTDIPSGAEAFDQIWEAPADTFFQYIPLVVGLYEYECTPHASSHGMIGSINVEAGTNSINDQELSDDHVVIFPNPTSALINIDGPKANSKYTIYTIHGDMVLSGKELGVIDVSSLRNGYYCLHIIGDKPRILKFIKQ